LMADDCRLSVFSQFKHKSARLRSFVTKYERRSC